MKKGFTLIETIVVVLIFTFLFAAILTVLTASNRSWRTAQNKLMEQQEARKAMDSIVRLLRQSNPDWVINGTHYPVIITEEAKRIDFYTPLFYPECCPNNCQPDDSVCRDGLGNLHNAGDIILKKITFKLNPESLRQLLKKEGVASSVVVANDIKDLKFGLASPTVTIDITTEKEKAFTLKSQMTLRNQNITLPEGVEIEQPAEGEF